MEFKYNNHSKYYDKSNQKQRVLRLVNDYTLYPGIKGINYTNMIDSNIEGFHWYDDEGYTTIDTELKIEICGLQAGPDFDPKDLDIGSSLDYKNNPSYIRGSKYQVTISQTN